VNEKYRIADLIVGIDGFDTLRQRARLWKLPADAQADFIISGRECAPERSGEAAEYTESEEQFHRACLKYDAVLLHSSAIVYQGRAYCFSGPSGTGKSTHTALWQACCGDSQVRILDDDRPMLRKVDGVWYAYGTPWNGKNRIGYNGKAPLGGIVFLHQGEENRIVPLEMGQALASL